MREEAVKKECGEAADAQTQTAGAESQTAAEENRAEKPEDTAGSAEGKSTADVQEKPEDRQEDGAAAPETDGGGSEEPDAKEKTSGEKKGFFKKKKDPKDEKIEELTDRVKRQMAEFDNFRKRTEKEKSAMYEMGAKDIIEKILPIVDILERGLASVPEDARDTPFAQGMEKVYKQFQKTLEDAGVKAIEAVGKEFDPNFHNAVMHVEDESLGENIVAEELQKGYMYRDSVVRHSMVKVAN